MAGLRMRTRISSFEFSLFLERDTSTFLGGCFFCRAELALRICEL